MVNEMEEKEGTKKERVKKYLFKRPKPLNTWGHQEHRSESWMELFIDLFYVAFFIKLGDILHTCGSGVDIMTYVCSIFLGLCMAKFDFDQYMNKFATEDLLHKVFFSVYSMGLVVMILDVNESSEHGDNDEKDSHSYGGGYDEHAYNNQVYRHLAGGSTADLPLDCPEVKSYISGFTTGWLITRASLLFMYIVIAAYVHPQGIFILESKAPILVASMMVMASNYFVPTSDSYVHTYIIMAAALLEILGWALWEVLTFGSWVVKTHGREVLIPTNIHHHASRTGTFVMLVLGEAVIALLTPTLMSSTRIYTFTLLGSLLIFMLAVMYFDVQPQQHAAHALGISRGRGMAWISLHPVLSFTLFGVGVSLKLIYEDRRLHVISDYNEMMLGVFLGISIFMMALLRCTHKVVFTSGGKFTFGLRCLIAALHIIVGAITLPPPIHTDEWKITVHVIISFLAVMVDTWKYRHLEVNSLSETATSKRASQRMSMAPNAGNKRHSTDRIPPKDGSSPTSPFRMRRSLSNPTDIVKSLHGDSRIKQINKYRRSSSGHIDTRGVGAPTPQKRFSFSSDRPLVKTDEVDVADLCDWEKRNAGDIQMSPKGAGRREESVGATSTGGMAGEEFYERTRVFEYDDAGNLVEVFDNEEGGHKLEDDYEYDEEYIEVIYEGEGGDEFDENEIHIMMDDLEEGENVASHITWL